MNFELTAQQVKKALEFERNHQCTLENHGTMGESFTYEFTPCGLGMLQSAKCACGERVNLTDFSDW